MKINSNQNFSPINAPLQQNSSQQKTILKDQHQTGLQKDLYQKDFHLRDLDHSQELYAQKSFSIYRNYNLEDLEKIKNDPSKRKEFYKTLNLAVYNNFHDISEILYKAFNKNASINIKEEERLNLNFKNDEGIEFSANVKSLPRIIEKMKRKNKNTLFEVTDIVRGRMDCKNINQAKEILEILKKELPKKNKEILEIDDMITNPRKDYKGRIHLLIKDKETGSIFELQIGSKNITQFIERLVTINYGYRELFINNGLNIIQQEDSFTSTYHDLIYKALRKLKNQPPYQQYLPDLEKINQKYLEIQDKIFLSEQQGTFDKEKENIEKELKNLDQLIQRIFSKIAKEDLIKALEEG